MQLSDVLHRLHGGAHQKKIPAPDISDVSDCNSSHVNSTYCASRASEIDGLTEDTTRL